jgi:hypothetical protein
MTPSPPGPLLSVRTALVLILSFMVGMSAAVLSYLADQPVPTAVLVGGGASGASLLLFHTLIGK